MISHKWDGLREISCFLYEPCTEMFYRFCDKRPCKDCILSKMIGVICGVRIRSGTFIALLEESEK